MFKEIVIRNQIESENGDEEKVERFNSQFGKDELFLKIIDQKIVLCLREVDINQLKNVAGALGSRYHDDFFDSVLQAVMKIGSYGIRGKKRNYVDYNKERKVIGRNEKEQKRGQYFYARNNSFDKTNRELPKDFENRIICGDSERVLKGIPDNTIDLIFTSPPYNFGLEYSGNPDDHFWNDYFNKLFRVFDECIRVLKWGGRIVVNIQPLFSDYIPSHHIISKFFMDRKLIWKGEILWEKNNYNCKYTAWGSWKSPSSPYLKYTWEFLEIFSKGSLKKGGRADDIDITADEFKDWVVAKWNIAPEREMKKYDHPAMFPEKLAERVLKLFSFKNDVILDPFNGVGTTTYVAKKSGRRYLGIDVSEEYCNVAHQRLPGITRLNKTKLKTPSLPGSVQSESIPH